MPSLSLDDRLIWFAHCPKAGGTSVEQVMVARWGERVGHLNWGWDRWWQRGGWREAAPPNSPQHLVWSDAQARLPRAPDAIFAMVRDPATRMASEYRWQRRHRQGTRLGRMIARLPFTVWLRLMLAAARIDPHIFDNHLRPASDFVPTEAIVFRLEDGLDAPLRWLEDATGAVGIGHPPHALQSGTGRDILSEEDAARIGQAFAVDYARFDYPRPPGLVPSRNLLDRIAEGLAQPVVRLYRRGLL